MKTSRCELCARELSADDPRWLVVPGQPGVAEVDGCHVRVPQTVRWCSLSCRTLWLANALLEQRSLIVENLEMLAPVLYTAGRKVA